MDKIVTLPLVKTFDRFKHYYTSIAVWTAAARGATYSCHLTPSQYFLQPNKIISLPLVKTFDRFKHYYTSIAVSEFFKLVVA